MRILRFALFCLASLPQLTLVSTANTLDDWEWVNPKPQGHSLWDVAYGNGMYIAVGGSGGTLLSSADHGVTWNSLNEGIDPNRTLNGVVYINGQFMALGNQNGKALISTSPDGVNWTDNIIGGDSTGVTGMAFGNDTYVTAGHTFTSNDGQNWTLAEGNANGGTDIAFGNGLFVATTRSGGFTSSIRTSTDGVTWTAVRDNDVNTTLESVAYGDGRFVAVGFQQSLVSTDAQEWTTTSLGSFFTPKDVIFHEGLFYATGQRIESSTDGITWNFETSLETFDPDTFEFISNYSGLGIAGSATSVVNVGYSGDTWSKVEDDSWTRRTEGFTRDPITDVAYGMISVEGSLVPRFVATHQALNAGANGGLMVSGDGLNWGGGLGSNQDLQAVAFGNNRFAAVGKTRSSSASNRVVYTSDDGEIFTEHILTETGVLLDIGFGNNRFVAVGQSGGIYTSVYTEGEPGQWGDWTKQESGLIFTLNGVAYGNDRFVVVGGPTPILVSADGVSWTSATGETTYTLFSVAYGNGIFVASGGATSLTSPDGDTWTEQSFPEGAAFKEIKFLNNQFVGISFTDSIWSSTNGLDWFEQPRFSMHKLDGITYDGQAYFLVGRDPWFPTSPTIIKSRVIEYPFKLAALRKLENGDVQINVFASPDTAVELRVTSDLQFWEVLDTITVSEVPTLYTDSTAGGFTRRIYQGVTDE